MSHILPMSMATAMIRRRAILLVMISHSRPIQVATTSRLHQLIRRTTLPIPMRRTRVRIILTLPTTLPIIRLRALMRRTNRLAAHMATALPPSVHHIRTTHLRATHATRRQRMLLRPVGVTKAEKGTAAEAETPEM